MQCEQGVSSPAIDTESRHHGTMVSWYRGIVVVFLVPDIDIWSRRKEGEVKTLKVVQLQLANWRQSEIIAALDMTALQSSPDGASGSLWACIAPGAGSRRLESWLHFEQVVLQSLIPGGDGTYNGGHPYGCGERMYSIPVYLWRFACRAGPIAPCQGTAACSLVRLFACSPAH
jgi:hypothetical protein